VSILLEGTPHIASGETPQVAEGRVLVVVAADKTGVVLVGVGVAVVDEQEDEADKSTASNVISSKSNSKTPPPVGPYMQSRPIVKSTTSESVV